MAAAKEEQAAQARLRAEEAVREEHDLKVVQAATAAARSATAVSVADELAKLAALRQQGILSEEELAAAKSRLLG